MLKDVREKEVDAGAEDVFAAVSRVGGERGWPSFMWAWKIRGRLDRLVGGVGLRRGRRDPERLRVGDALDLWRVEELTRGGPGQDWVLRLRAEMKVPGQAWLEFRIRDRSEEGTSSSTMVQRALFAPRGVAGRLYWLMFLPIHPFIFSSQIDAIAKDAEELARSDREAEVTSSGVLSVRPEDPGGGRPERDDPQPARTAG